MCGRVRPGGGRGFSVPRRLPGHEKVAGLRSACHRAAHGRTLKVSTCPIQARIRDASSIRAEVAAPTFPFEHGPQHDIRGIAIVSPEI